MDSVTNPFDMRLLVKQDYGFSTDDLAFLLKLKKPGGVTMIGQPVTMVEHPGEGGFRSHVKPSFTLSYDAAQELMDALYSAGIRPRQARDHATTVDAINKHLTDMRAIAFGMLEMVKP